MTLVGGPGIGKTRLALQVADTLWDAFRDGVYVIALATLTEPGQVTTAIAQGLGLRESPAGALDDAVREFLRDSKRCSSWTILSRRSRRAGAGRADRRRARRAHAGHEPGAAAAVRGA